MPSGAMRFAAGVFTNSEHGIVAYCDAQFTTRQFWSPMDLGCSPLQFACAHWYRPIIAAVIFGTCFTAYATEPRVPQYLYSDTLYPHALVAPTPTRTRTR